MERLTGKGAKSLKEAYAKVYIEEQIKVPDYASMSDEEFSKLVQKSGNPEGVIAKRLQQRKAAANEKVGANYTADDAKADQERAKTEAENKRRESRGENSLPVPQGSKLKDPKSTAPAGKTYTIGGKTYSSKAEINKEYDRLRKSGGDAKAFGDKAFKATNKPAIGTTPGGTKFERRTPTSAELRAAQAARASGKGSEGQIKAAVQQGQRQASVNAAVKSANRPEVLNKPAPAGSALAAQQNRLTQQNKVQKEVAAVKSGMDANQKTSVNNTVKSGTVPTGNTIKTKVNPDSSMSVTQRRTPAATKKITQSLALSSVDLFDIVKGQFIEEGYSEEDTMYLMANLNEEQLNELMGFIRKQATRYASKIPFIKKLINKTPTQMPAGDIGALRLYQDKANQSIRRLNKQTTRLDANAAQREANRVNNLNPRVVDRANKSREFSQITQRNLEKGRPADAAPQPVDKLNYKPGDPMFDDYVKRHHANQRRGASNYGGGANRIDPPGPGSTNTGVRRINK